MLLKVLTFNIRHGEGTDRKVDLSRVLDVLRASKADVIGLNEVDSRCLRSGFKNQARWLAANLEMHFVFAPAHRRIIARTGNAILSRFPLVASELIPLTSTGQGRVALKAVAAVGDQAAATHITCICTHFGLSSEERLAQAGEVLAAVRASRTETSRTILMGDLNASPDKPEVGVISQQLIDAMSGKDLPTFPNPNPKTRIDYVFISKNCAIIDAGVTESEASDHLAVFAALEV